MSQSKWRSQLLSKARAPWIFAAAALLGVLLSLPALWAGLMMDDYPHRLFFQSPDEFQRPGGAWGDWDLFRFQGEDRDYFRDRHELGLWPWWTAPKLRLAFFRPLSALSHQLDYQLWPDAAWLMHAESLALYGLLALLVGWLYRRTLGAGAAAGLAAILYAVDDAHSMPIVWIANRNALWAGVFGVAALLAHDRWRREGWRTGAWLGPLLFALGMLSGETALGALAYLFAHALCFEWGGLRPRLAALWPYALVSGLWAVAYVGMGYGASGGGFYLDPLREPLRFLAAFVERFPQLVAAQLALPPADLWAVADPAARGYGLLLVLAVIAGAGWTLWRGVSKNKTAAFFALGMILSLLPVCATIPSDRLLLLSGIGAFGLLGSLLSSWLNGGFARPWLAWAAGALFLLHGILAPLLLPLRISFLSSLFHGSLVRAEASLPSPTALHDKTLVVLNAPDPLVPSYALALRYSRGSPRPRHLRQLSVVQQGTLSVSRPDAATLVLQPSAGFFQDPLSQVFRDGRSPFHPGEQVILPRMTATAGPSLPDGRPAAVTFTFDTPLEDPSLVLLTWSGARFIPYQPPPVGGTHTLPAINYAAAMLGDTP